MVLTIITSIPLCGKPVNEQKTVIKGNTYCSGILHDVLDITCCVNFLRRICTVDSKLGVLCNFKWKTLTIRDMPVESVELSSL